MAVQPWDTNGAHEAGLRTAWINRTGSPYPQPMHAADLQVTSLTALARFLSDSQATTPIRDALDRRR